MVEVVICNSYIFRTFVENDLSDMKSFNCISITEVSMTIKKNLLK